LSTGTYAARLTVKDANGAVGTVTDSLWVRDDPPDVTISPLAHPARAGWYVRLDTSVEDYPSNVDDLTYQWTVTGDPSGPFTGTGSGFGFTPTAAGTYVASVQVTDGHGGSNSANLTFSVSELVMYGRNETQEDGTLSLTPSFREGAFPGPWSYQWTLTNVETNQVVATHQSATYNSYSSTLTSTFSPTVAAQGQYEAKLALFDGAGGTHYARDQYWVTNVVPRARILGPTAFDEGSSPTFTVTATDSANDVLAYQWSLTDEAGEVLATGTTGTFTPDVPENHGYYINVVATDSHGQQSPEAHLHVERTNVAPTAAIAGGESATPEGDPVGLTATASDPGGTEALAYAWSVTRDGEAEPLEGYGGSSDHLSLLLGAGAYTVQLSVTDADGVTTTATKDIVIANVAPAVEIAGDDATALVGEQIQLRGMVGDAGPVAGLVYAWTVQRGGTVIATGSEPNLTFTPAQAGDYSAALLVTDGGGLGTSATAVVTAGALSIAGPSAADEGTMLDLAPRFTTSPPAPLTYHWTLARDGAQLSTGSGPTFRPTLGTGNYRVSLIVTDASSNTFSSFRDIKGINVAPTVSISGGGPSLVPGVPVHVTAAVSDPGDSTESYSYLWTLFRNGVPIGEATTGGSSYTFTPNAAGVYGVTALATDSDGAASEPVERLFGLAPIAPDGLTAAPGEVPGGRAFVDLQWQDNSADETGFDILRSTDAIHYYAVGRVGANATVFRDDAPDAGVRNYYKVVAVSGATGTDPVAESTPSDAASGLVGARRPVAVDDRYAGVPGELLEVAVALDGLLANDAGACGCRVTVTSYTQPAFGTVELRADGTIVYSPADAFQGTDWFTYTISDGSATATGTVELLIAPAGMLRAAAASASATGGATAGVESQGGNTSTFGGGGGGVTTFSATRDSNGFLRDSVGAIDWTDWDQDLKQMNDVGAAARAVAGHNPISDYLWPNAPAIYLKRVWSDRSRVLRPILVNNDPILDGTYQEWGNEFVDEHGKKITAFDIKMSDDQGGGTLAGFSLKHTYGRNVSGDPILGEGKAHTEYLHIQDQKKQLGAPREYSFVVDDAIFDDRDVNRGDPKTPDMDETYAIMFHKGRYDSAVFSNVEAVELVSKQKSKLYFDGGNDAADGYVRDLYIINCKNIDFGILSQRTVTRADFQAGLGAAEMDEWIRNFGQSVGRIHVVQPDPAHDGVGITINSVPVQFNSNGVIPGLYGGVYVDAGLPPNWDQEQSLDSGLSKLQAIYTNAMAGRPAVVATLGRAFDKGALDAGVVLRGYSSSNVLHYSAPRDVTYSYQSGGTQYGVSTAFGYGWDFIQNTNKRLDNPDNAKDPATNEPVSLEHTALVALIAKAAHELPGVDAANPPEVDVAWPPVGQTAGSGSPVVQVLPFRTHGDVATSGGTAAFIIDATNDATALSYIGRLAAKDPARFVIDMGTWRSPYVKKGISRTSEQGKAIVRVYNALRGLSIKIPVVIQVPGDGKDLDQLAQGSTPTLCFPAAFGRANWYTLLGWAKEPGWEALKNVIVVGAANTNGGVLSKSARGASSVDVLAPGQDVTAWWGTEGVASTVSQYKLSGTAVAAGYVSTLAGILRLKDPMATAEVLLERIRQSAAVATGDLKAERGMIDYGKAFTQP